LANNLVKSFSPQVEEPVVVTAEPLLPDQIQTEEDLHTSDEIQT